MRATLVLCLLLVSWSAQAMLPEPGAAAPRPSAATGETDPEPIEALAASLRTEARRLGQAGQRRLALERLKILTAIAPDDPLLADTVRTEEETLRLEAEQIYRRGLEYHRLGNFAAARHAYLSALKVDPEHYAAVEELKNGLYEDSITYRPRARESLSRIAAKVYGSAGMAPVLAAANNLGSEGAVAAGHLVVVPRLEKSLLAAAADRKDVSRQEGPVAAAAGMPERYKAGQLPDVDTLLAEARTHFNERRYREAIDTAAKIPSTASRGEEAREIINGAYFRVGTRLAEEGKYPLALEAYRRVDISYRNVDETILGLEKRMADLAEEHYIAGVKLFVDQRLDEAIVEWEQTLALNPSHEKAGEDIRKASKLLEELKKVK